MTATQLPATFLGAKSRVLIFGAYLLLAYGMNRWLTGSWVPGSTGKDLWFLSFVGLAAFSLISAPFFQKPDDVLASSLTTLVALWGSDLTSASYLRAELGAVRVGAVIYTSLVALVSGYGTYVRRRPPNNPQSAKVAHRLSNRLGAPSVLFTAPALIGAFGFFDDAPEKTIAQVIVWVFVSVVRPLELLWLSIRNFVTGSAAAARIDVIGTVSRVDSPDIVRVKLVKPEGWQPDSVLAVRLADGSAKWVMPLFSQLRDGSLVGTGLCAGEATGLSSQLPRDSVYAVESAPPRDKLIQDLSKTEKTSLVGFVVENSRIAAIQFEVASISALQEGALVFCREGGDAVFYQVVDARTSEESFERNPRGTHIVNAVQLGIRSTEKGFLRFAWLPSMNTPVFATEGPGVPEDETPLGDRFVLGHIPGTVIPVWADLGGICEFHAAILGVTGSGKTELVFDVVRRAMATGTKVIGVDFTGEYAARLKDLEPVLLGLDSDQSERFTGLVDDIELGQYKSEAEKRKLLEYLDELTPTIVSQIDGLLTPEGGALGILELPEMANTRSTLRATEMYLSTVFDWARAHRQARRILLVLEEAHTVVPEFNMFGFDKGDTQAVVGRMAQIALQGRKYGVGILLVSQRTALVSKTLLSQCGTVIAFSMVDQTSLSYLSTVFSEEHVRAVPNLPSLRALAFGKGIRSERPIVVEIRFDQGKKDASDALRQPIGGATAPLAPLKQPAVVTPRGGQP